MLELFRVEEKKVFQEKSKLDMNLNLNIFNKLKTVRVSKSIKKYHIIKKSKLYKNLKLKYLKGLIKTEKNLFFIGTLSNLRKFYLKYFFMDLIKQGFIKKGKKVFMDKFMYNLSTTALKKTKLPKTLLLNYRVILLNLIRLVRLKERKTRRSKRYKVDILMGKSRLKKGILEVVKPLNQSTDSKSLKDKIIGVTEDLKKGSSKANETRNEYHKTALK